MKKSARKVLTLVLALALVLSLASQVSAAGFDDTSGHWAANAIERWTNYKVLNGYPDGTFRPNNTSTRAELFKIIDTLFAFKAGTSNQFSDVSSSDWYYESVNHLAAIGILKGDGGLARGNDSITREEAFVLIARLLSFEGDESALAQFTDGGDVSDWAKSTIGGMVKAGYIKGSDSKLNPKANITRAEIVTVLDNAIDVYINTPGVHTFTSEGNVVIVADNVTLKDCTISGNLYSSDSITISADNVKIEGETNLGSDSKLTEGAATPTPTPTPPVSSGSSSGSGSSGSSFSSRKAKALEAIEAANLPDAAEFAEAGKSVCIPDQEIVKWPEYENPIFGQQGADAVINEKMIPYTTWDIGHPAIESDLGNVDATGVYKLIEDMLAKASSSYKIEEDKDFADFLAFSELYAPAAVAGTPVAVKRCSIASTVRCEDPDSDFESSQPYHVYKAAVEVGVGPTVLRVLDSIPSSSPFSLGPATYDSLEAYVYDLGINNEGVVVSYERVSTDNVTSHGAYNSGKIRIGYYLDEEFEIANGAKLYTFKNVTVDGKPDTVIGTAEFSSLTEDWNDSIRAVFDDSGKIVEAYMTVVDGAGNKPAYLDQIQRYTYEYGVEPDDPTYGFDGVENPYGVDYALYNPTKEDGANQNAKYPLFVFFHGIGGGGNKNGLVTNELSFGIKYITPEYQAQFETNTEGVHGAYIMLPRANERNSHDLGTQGWLTGYRAETNPHYAAGDESYKGKATQTAAVIADIKYLIDHEKIDPNRIYIGGFSAGGYMTWATLFDGKDMFAAAVPGGAAFFPEGSQLKTDYSEFELGLKNKLLSVKDVPIWMYHARNDGTCAWDITAGDPAKNQSDWINGWSTLPQMVRSFADGKTADGKTGISGNPLTRVTIHNFLHDGTGRNIGMGSQHSAQLVVNNNVYTDVTVGGTKLTYFDKIYAEKPADYAEASPSPEAQDSLYAFGINTEFATATPWGDTFISWLNACGRAKANPGQDQPGNQGTVDAAKRQAALDAIAAAKLPDMKTFSGTIVVPSEEITDYFKYSLGVEGGVDKTKHPFTEYKVGNPEIKSTYGNVAATGVYKAIDEMLATATGGYDIEKDADFANWNAFRKLHEPAAIKGTPVATGRYYLVSNRIDTATSTTDYNVFPDVIKVGDAQVTLKVLKSIPTKNEADNSNRYNLSNDYLGNYVYDMGINKDGVAVCYSYVKTESVKSYGAVDNGKIRISYYLDEVFDIAEGAKLFITSAPAGQPATITASSFSTLTADDWNDSIRAVYNDNGEIVEAYLTVVDGAGEEPANLAQIQKFTYETGVEPDDRDYYYDGEENPWAVDYALYDPVANGKDSSTKYPLFVFFHGLSGGRDKNGLPVNNNQAGLNYISDEYQNEFKTSNDQVHGAYVMLPRSNDNTTVQEGSQGWLHGYRGLTNPLYAAGDEDYKGRSTQVAAVIADIKYLVDNNPNIDPDRIYITGFSAGGYMTWATLFEGKGMFAAAAPGGAALFPNGTQFPSDYAEFELGLTDRLLAVKDVPIWMYHARNDGTCTWDLTAGDAAKDSKYYINGWSTLPQMVRSFADGKNPDGEDGGVKGSDLTRVTIHNYLHNADGSQAVQHSAVLVATNNKYNFTVGETPLSVYDRVYAEDAPEGYDEANPSDADKDSLYAFGINTTYSTAKSWSDDSGNTSFISWLNACGDAKSNPAD